MTTREEYEYRKANKIECIEWFLKDIERNVLTSNPANETNVQCFSNQKQVFNTNLITFSAENEEKRIIRGMVMRSGQWIGRNNIDGNGNFGYCYFSEQTVTDMHDNFFLDKLSINHTNNPDHNDVTGDAILVKSWLEKNIFNGQKCLEWWLDYKVITDRLWRFAKQNKLGFSIEGFFTTVKQSNSFLSEKKNIIRNSSDFTKEDLDQKFRWILSKSKDNCPSCVAFNGQVKTLRQWIMTALPRTPIGTLVVDLSTSGAHNPYNTFCEQSCKCYMERVK